MAYTPKNIEKYAEKKMLDKALVAKIKEGRDFRVKQEALWMELDYMIDGNHYIYYDKSTHEIRTLPIQRRGTIRRTVNIIKSKLRSVTNMINKSEPAFNIEADYSQGMTPEEKKKADQKADIIQNLCLNVYRSNNLKQKFKRAVRLGQKRGLAYAQYVWDMDEDDINVIIDDPYDIIVDPTCEGDIQKAAYIRKDTIVSMDYLESNENFKNVKLLEPTSKLNESTYRNSFLEFKYTNTSAKDRYLLSETWVKKQKKSTETENGETTQEMKTVVQVTYSCNDVELYTKEYNYTKYPFCVYYPEEPDGEMYPRPPFADLIGLNKSLDATYSFREEYMATCGVGRYLKHKKSKLITPSTGQHGQIIEWSGTTPPTPMDIPPFPHGVVQSHLSDTERYMSDIGGVQFLDAGQIIGSNTSGRAIAQLQAQQSESVGEPTENLAYFAKQLFEGIIELMIANYQDPRNVKSGEEVFKVRGAGGLNDLQTKEGLESQGEIILDEVPSFHVEIIPGSAYSDLQQKDDLTNLYDRKAIDTKTLLEGYKLGNTRETLERLEEEQENAALLQAKQKQLEALSQQHAQMMGGQAPQMMQQMQQMQQPQEQPPLQ